MGFSRCGLTEVCFLGWLDGYLCYNAFYSYVAFGAVLKRDVFLARNSLLVHDHSDGLMNDTYVILLS